MVHIVNRRIEKNKYFKAVQPNSKSYSRAIRTFWEKEQVEVSNLLKYFTEKLGGPVKCKKSDTSYVEDRNCFSSEVARFQIKKSRALCRTRVPRACYMLQQPQGRVFKAPFLLGLGLCILKYCRYGSMSRVNGRLTFSCWSRTSLKKH